MATEPRIGTKIRRARERKRWTQQQLADTLGVSRTTVDAWENDRAYPRSSVGAIEEVLSISLAAEGGLRVISPHLRKLIRETLPDPEDERRVIGLLEGTLVWPEESPAEPGQTGAQSGSAG